MAKISTLSSREKSVAVLLGSTLLIVLVAFGIASAQEAPKPTPATPAESSATTSTVSDLDNQKRQIKDELDHAKNLRDELRRIKKDIPEIDISAALEQVSKYESCVNAVQPGAEDFWGVLSPCNDYSRTVEDDLNDRLRPIQNCANNRKGIQDRKRERKDIERQIKDILRQDKTADVSALQTLLGQIDALLAQADQFSKCASTDDRDGLEPIAKDIGDLFNDFYSLSQDTRDKANLVQCRTDNKKEFEKNLKRQCEKDQAREMKNLEKDFAKAEKAGQVTEEDRANFTATKDNFTAMCVTQMGAMQQALNADDCDAFNDARNEFHTLNQDFYELTRVAREGFNVKQQLKDIERDWKRWEKDIANLKKEYEQRVKRTGTTDAEMESLLKQIDEKFAEAQEVAKTDPSSWWNEYQTTINEFMQAFWERNQEVFEKVERSKNTERWLKDVEKEVKFREKDLKNMKRDENLDSNVLKTLEDILVEMKNALTRTREVLLASDPDAAEEILREMDDLRYQWDETSRSMWENNDFKFRLEEALRIIEYIKKELERLVDEGKLSKNEVDQCRSFVDKVEVGAKALNPGDDIEEYFDSFEDEAKSVCPTLDELINEEGLPRPDHEYYQDFLEENVRGLDNDFTAEILTKVSEDVVAKIMQRLLNDPSVVEAFLKATGARQDIASNTLEAVTIYNESEQKEILSKKAEILELNKQLEGLQVQLKAAQEQLVAIQKELESYNFYGSAADTIRDQMEDLIAQIQGADEKTKQRLIEELNVKKDEAIRFSKEAKWQEKKIPFLDADDNFWGTKHIAKAARCEFARGKGDGSNFDPGGDVRVAEILTMAFRASKDETPDGDSNLCNGKYKGHWGNKFIRWAEDKGLSIVSSCTDADRPALRWEIAQVLGELAAGGKLPASSEACFSDVKASDKSPNAAVCYAKAKGFMKGTDGKANAYSRVNRAEGATMVVSVAEKHLGFQCSAQEEEAPPPSNRRSGEEDEEDDEEDEEDDEAAAGYRSRCYWDDQCQDLMSAQLMTEDQCKAAGGESFGPDEDECKDI